MDDATLRTIKLANIEALTEKEYGERLYPMLRRGHRPPPQELHDIVLPTLREMLVLNAAETEFGQRLEQGEYAPTLLFEDIVVSEAVSHHPAAERRRQYPHRKSADESK